jgi:hypothetical protein
MIGPNLLHVHREFPGLPSRALDFFDLRNAKRTAGALAPRTVAEFANAIAKPGDAAGLTIHPPYQRLDFILHRMADLNLLTVANQGTLGAHDAAYFCTLSDAQKTGLASTLDYVVYGFPVIYEDLCHSVLPLIHRTPDGAEAIGTAFLSTRQTILTAAHCIKGAKALSIRGISVTEFAAAEIAINEGLDVAAIHFPKPVLSGCKPIETGAGEVLEEVITLGYPNVPGFTEVLAAEKAAISTRITVTRGSVASKATEIFAKVPLFLITARVRGGFSGGPVINGKGLAVGVVSSQPVSGGDSPADFYSQYDNLGYGVAIPSEEVSKFLAACGRRDESLASFIDPSRLGYRPFPE